MKQPRPAKAGRGCSCGRCRSRRERGRFRETGRRATGRPVAGGVQAKRDTQTCPQCATTSRQWKLTLPPSMVSQSVREASSSPAGRTQGRRMERRDRFAFGKTDRSAIRTSGQGMPCTREEQTRMPSQKGSWKRRKGRAARDPLNSHLGGLCRFTLQTGTRTISGKTLHFN